MNNFQDEDDGESGIESTGRKKAWDDELILKRQFSSMVPAFDPRPGRTNVNQIQDFEIPPPGSELPSSSAAPWPQPNVEGAPRLHLTIKNFPGQNVCKCLFKSLFQYIFLCLVLFLCSSGRHARPRNSTY